MDIGSLFTGIVLTVTGAASAVTGGVTAGPGENIVTGDSSASVQVTNVINADNDGGTSHTEIIKSVDGKTTTEVIDKDFAPGEPVVVEQIVEAISGAASTSVVTNTKATTTTGVAARANLVFQFISQLFHSLFGIFFR